MTVKLSVAILAILAGCSYSRPVSIAQIQLGPKERPIAIVQGEATATYFLGFRMDGEDSLGAAIEDAKQKVHVDRGTLYNVFVDKKYFVFPFLFLPLYQEVTTSVYGTLVSYDDPWFNRVYVPAPTSSNVEISTAPFVSPWGKLFRGK